MDKNKKEIIENKLNGVDNQIEYMRQVSKGKKYPSAIKEVAQESLKKLLKEREDFLSELQKL